jgi:hypothetical protein
MDSVCNSSVWETNANFLHVVGGGVHAAHHTLVIALEEDGNERKGLDGNIKLLGRQSLPPRGDGHCVEKESRWGVGNEVIDRCYLRKRMVEEMRCDPECSNDV